eukprot:CAMPEP_0202854560 /NCGR_PEP_ID=MMETSP1389-20130828/91065_1 /ASSEMBLY_ACC=CAM_ASM_000865 /TAXON_ID=302021 /ORGANISM="Rhodomonas sp., Strain CCMP768" /LENGTH=257 /DNA_ID=CAMNT_0049533155 /DNA_START=121 /DNA_END=895 /DNA_ORIENTATION=-
MDIADWLTDWIRQDIESEPLCVLPPASSHCMLGASPLVSVRAGFGQALELLERVATSNLYRLNCSNPCATRVSTNILPALAMGRVSAISAQETGAQALMEWPAHRRLVFPSTPQLLSYQNTAFRSRRCGSSGRYASSLVRQGVVTTAPLLPALQSREHDRVCLMRAGSGLEPTGHQGFLASCPPVPPPSIPSLRLQDLCPCCDGHVSALSVRRPTQLGWSFRRVDLDITTTGFHFHLSLMLSPIPSAPNLHQARGSK